MDFLEASLTADHFAGCLQQAEQSRTQDVRIALLLVRNVIELACTAAARTKGRRPREP